MVYKQATILLFISLLCLVGCARNSISKKNEEKTKTQNEETVKPQEEASEGLVVKDAPPEESIALTEVRHFGVPETDVLDLAISPDGYRALSAGNDKIVHLWDMKSGKEIRRLIGHKEDVFSVAFSPDGRLALSGGSEGAVCLWDLKNGKMINRFQILQIQSKEIADYEHYITSVKFSPDGRQALFGAGDSTIRLWDMESRKEIRQFKGPEGLMVNCVAFSPDGRQAISCSGEYEGDSIVLIWDLATGEKIGSLEDEGYFSVIGRVAFSPDGSQAIAGCGSGQDHTNGKVVIWDLKSRNVVHRLEIEKTGVTSLAFSPDGRRILFSTSTSDRGIVRLWDLKSEKEICRYTENEQEILTVVLSRDGHQVLSGSRGGAIRLFNLPQ